MYSFLILAFYDGLQVIHNVHFLSYLRLDVRLLPLLCQSRSVDFQLHAAKHERLKQISLHDTSASRFLKLVQRLRIFVVSIRPLYVM